MRDRFRARAHVFATLAFCVAIIPGTGAAQETTSAEHVPAIAHNTVRVESPAGSGFGFVVGFRNDSLLVATARHVLGPGWEVEANVCFPPHGADCVVTASAYLAHAVGDRPSLDLAILAVPDPGDLAWRPDVEDRASPGDPVWAIGRSGDWWITPRPGRVVGIDAARRQVSYLGLDVAPGTSGAPVVGRRGIVALHLEGESDSLARGIELAAIRERVTEHMEGMWALVPPADCASADIGGGDLESLRVVVRIDPTSPAAGLAATALLRCAGARTQIRLHAPADVSEARTIVYRSGGLREARFAQRLLSSIAPLESRLGEPTGDLDISLPR